MPPESSLPAARAQLLALTADGRIPGFDALRAIPLPDEPRAAAVLILFGALDSTPSAHVLDDAVPRDLDVLLLARASTLRSHPGQVAFPGGRVDPGDDGVVGAALREAHEETGLDPAGVEVLGTLEQVPVYPSSHIVTPVIGWWRHPSDVDVVDEAESAAVFRAPVADLLDPANRGVTVLRRGGGIYRSPAFQVRQRGDEHIVWGFTAMVLDAVFDSLGWTEPWDRSREVSLP